MKSIYKYEMHLEDGDTISGTYPIEDPANAERDLSQLWIEKQIRGVPTFHKTGEDELAAHYKADAYGYVFATASVTKKRIE